MPPPGPTAITLAAGGLERAGSASSLRPAKLIQPESFTSPYNAIRRHRGWLLAAAFGGSLLGVPAFVADSADEERYLDYALAAELRRLGFTGNIEATLERRLGRKLDRRLADLGRLLWFDTLQGLNDDNTCAGCHSPTNGFGDTQSIAIGIDNNGIVGPDRAGPRNQRRSPMVLNAAFFPRLMWNSRFASLSGDPFDHSRGFQFPEPEGFTLSYLPHLLTAQAFIPPTERNEAAGFVVPGDNFAIREQVLQRLNASPAYRRLFGRVFPRVREGRPIDFDMFGLAISEFTFSLTLANAPIDEFARGKRNAMTPEQKRGAVLFFGKARCVDCHAVSGQSNEMFSDFSEHVIGVPQVAPRSTNSLFDGVAVNEDFGKEQVTADPADRYEFRTSPLRNVALQAAFFHNGAFTSLDAAVRHHLDPVRSAVQYDPREQELDSDLLGPPGPAEPVLRRLDPRLATPPALREDEIRDLVTFLRDGLLDPRARPGKLRRLVPDNLPSGRPPLVFQFEDARP